LIIVKKINSKNLVNYRSNLLIKIVKYLIAIDQISGNLIG